MKNFYSATGLVLLAILFLALTILAGSLLRGVRIDLTEQGLYTLSPGTVNILEDLEEPVTLVAHDWGGMIAMGWAVRHPERVGRIVLMNTAAFHLPDGMKMPPTLAFVRDTRLASFLVRHLNLFSRGATWLATARRLPKPVRDAYCAPYDSPAHRIATLRFVQDIPLEPGDPAYDTVSEIESSLALFEKTPVLLLWGEKDFVFKPEVLEIFERIWPHAESHRFAKAGHYVLEDAGEEIRPLVRDFLERHSI